MAIIGTVPVQGPVAPTALDDEYPAHDAIYGKGGHREDDMTLIPAARKREGMTVFHTGAGGYASGQTYQYISGGWHMLIPPYSLIDGYDAAKKQVLTHDNGTLKWVELGSC